MRMKCCSRVALVRTVVAWIRGSYPGWMRRIRAMTSELATASRMLRQDRVAVSFLKIHMPKASSNAPTTATTIGCRTYENNCFQICANATEHVDRSTLPRIDFVVEKRFRAHASGIQGRPATNPNELRERHSKQRRPVRSGPFHILARPPTSTNEVVLCKRHRLNNPARLSLFLSVTQSLIRLSYYTLVLALIPVRFMYSPRAHP